MATATLSLHEPETGREGDPPARQRRRGRRWPRAVAALLVLLVPAAWFAPAVLARSGLRHRLVQAVVPAYPGRASVGAASLNWLDPVVLRDVTLSDPDGGALVRVGELRTSLPLARLLFAAGGDLGTVTIVRPEVAVRLRPGGSNLEDTLGPLMEGPGSTAGLTVVVEEGRVLWTGIDGKPAKGGIDGLSAKVVRAAGASSVRGEVRGRLGNGEASGEFAVEVAPAVEKDSGALGVTVAAKGLPAGAVRAWLDRFDVGATVEGFVSADLSGTLAPGDAGSWSVEGKVHGQRLWATVSDLAGEEPVKVESLTLAGKVSRVGDRLALEKVELRSDVGTATADGRFDVAALSAGGWTGQVDALLAQEGSVTGSADLARVAAAFGRVLKLKQPVESGRLDVELRVSGGDGGRRVGVVKVGVMDLVAGAAEQRLTWREPLTVDVAVRRDAGGIVVERLRAESEGVTLAGSGSLAGAEMRFEADLDQVRVQLARLIELPEGALSGRAEGRITARRPNAAGLVAVEAVASVRSLALVLPGRRWSERELTLRSSADVRLDGLSAAGVERGSLGLRSIEGDELTAKLTGPVALGDGAAWPAEVGVKGDLRRWSERGAAWSVSPLPAGWSADGTLDAGGSLLLASDAVEVSNFAGEARGFRLRTTDRTLEEPYVRVTGSGRWDAAGGLLALSSATLTSETMSGQGTEVRLPLAGVGAASGRITFRGGAGRIARYVLPPQPPVWLSGVVGGTVELSSDAAATVADAKLEFEKPVLTRPVAAGPQVEWRAVWSDERLTAEVRARYHHVGDTLELTSAVVSATGLAVEATGRVGRVTTVADAELSGSVDCDLEPLSRRLAAGLPGGIAATGRSKRPFAVRGPLLGVGGVDPALAASAGLGWEQVNAFGLALGSGELSGRLAGRTVTIQPFDWGVAGGHVRAAPVLSLDGTPTLRLAKGRVAEDVHLTPELSRTWLRYAAPVLADATQVQGTVSLDIGEAGVPLVDPSQAKADGVLVLQGAEATPGPLARSILDAVRQVQAIAGHDGTNGSDLRLVAPPQSVTVKIAGGRVSHDRFVVRVGDENGPAVATSGSVGFDETLDLVADVPLDAKWFKNERVAAALGGQALRVPIRGALARPAPDARAFQDLARRAAAGVVNGAIERGIEKQVSDPLRKLLDRAK